MKIHFYVIYAYQFMKYYDGLAHNFGNDSKFVSQWCTKRA